MSFFKPNSMMSSPQFKAGVEHGKAQLSMEILTWLQTKYNDDSVVRKTPKAVAILELTRELAKYLRSRV